MRKQKILLDETKYNGLINKKRKKECKYLNYVAHLLISASAVTGYVSISEFVSLMCVLIDESNGIRTHNHLVYKQTISHFAKKAK